MSCCFLIAEREKSHNKWLKLRSHKGSEKKSYEKRHVSISIICCVNVILALSNYLLLFWMNMTTIPNRIPWNDCQSPNFPFNFDKFDWILGEFSDLLFAMAKKEQILCIEGNMRDTKKGGLISVTYDICMVCAKHDVIHTNWKLLQKFARACICVGVCVCI